MAKPCISCGINIEATKDSATFKCPGCAEAEVVRCGRCRKAGKPYRCPNCGFEGP